MRIRVTDDRDRIVYLARPAARVVSLVPSDTFSTCALGCAGALVGRTDYCEEPKDLSVPSVGGTKNPRLDEICDLRPDLVLANQEENTRADLEALAQRGVKVYVAFPKRVADGLAHLARLAQVLGVAAAPGTRALVKAGYEALREAEAAASGRPPAPTFCPIWLDPLMTIHGDTYVSDVLAVCGAANVFSDRRRRYPLGADLGEQAPLPEHAVAGRDTRYPRVSWDEVRHRAPELVLLPDEPYAFTEDDAVRFRSELPGAARVVRTSGKDLTWYGAWSVDALPRVRALVAGS